MKNELSKKPLDLDQENERLWGEISSVEFMFNRSKKYKSLLDGITREDIE